MILFGSEYAGPAKYFSILLENLNIQTVCVLSPVTADILKKSCDICIDSISELHKTPSLIIVGRCFGDCLDKKLHDWGVENSIKVISIINHWSWYREGYTLNGTVKYPDYIFVNDTVAYSDALNEGLQKDRLVIAGNPVLEQLLMEDIIKKDRNELLQEYNLPKNKRIIVFVSEELSSEFNNTDSYLGYDEYDVLKILLKNLIPAHHLIIKQHPEERSDKYSSYVNKQITTLETIDVHSLDAVADDIIGMASILLLELAMLRNDVISFRPNATKEFIGKRLQATIDINTIEEFERCFTQKEKREVDGRFRAQFKGSTSRIVSLIEKLSK